MWHFAWPPSSNVQSITIEVDQLQHQLPIRLSDDVMDNDSDPSNEDIISSLYV
jgi:hypothetical protein